MLESALAPGALAGTARLSTPAPARITLGPASESRAVFQGSFNRAGYLHIHMYAYTYIYIHMYMNLYIDMHTYTYLCTGGCTCICLSVHLCIYIYIHTYVKCIHTLNLCVYVYRTKSSHVGSALIKVGASLNAPVWASSLHHRYGS